METVEIVLLVLGVLTITVSITLAVRIPNPTPSQMWSFRVITSIGSACIGAIIPGLIELDGSYGELAIRASGALALFLVVYLLNPPPVARQMMNKKI